MTRWNPVHVIPRVKSVCEPSFGSPGPLYHFFAFSSSHVCRKRYRQVRSKSNESFFTMHLKGEINFRREKVGGGGGLG